MKTMVSLLRFVAPILALLAVNPLVAGEKMALPMGILDLEPRKVRSGLDMLRKENANKESPIKEKHLSEYEECSELFEKTVPIFLKKSKATLQEYASTIPDLDRMIGNLSSDNPFQITLLYFKHVALSKSGDEDGATSIGLGMIHRVTEIRSEYGTDAWALNQAMIPVTMRVAAGLKNLTADQKARVDQFLESESESTDLQVRVNAYLNQGRYYMNTEKNLDEGAKCYKKYYDLLPEFYGPSYGNTATRKRIRFANKLLEAGRKDLAVDFVAEVQKEEVESSYHRSLLERIRSTDGGESSSAAATALRGMMPAIAGKDHEEKEDK